MYYSSSYSSAGELSIMHNNVQSIRVRLRLDSNVYEGTASGTTVLSLNKGDQVHVQADRANMFIDGRKLSFFSGFLLS